MLKIFNETASKNSKSAILSNVLFYDDRVQVCDGLVTVDCASPLEPMQACVNSKRLTGFLNTTGVVTSQNITSHNLILKKSRINARLPLVIGAIYPKLQAERVGIIFKPTQEFRDRIKNLAEFMSDDATHAWANGVYIADDGKLMATNNVVFAMTKTSVGPMNTGGVLLSASAIAAIFSCINEVEEVYVQERKLVLFLSDGSWISVPKSGLAYREIAHMLSIECNDLIPVGMLDATEDILKLSEDKVMGIIAVDGNTVSTQDEAGDIDILIQGDKSETAHFRTHYLVSVLRVASHLNIQADDRFAVWRSEHLVGAVAKVKA